MSENITIGIIGAGASGLMCAMLCAKNGLKVDIYEQNDKCGKKILVSGNGRCNISNTSLTYNDYFSQNPLFVSHAIEEFGFEQFKKFVNSLGLFLDIKEDGRVYPLSNEAKSVVKIFEEHAKSLGVTFHTNHQITSLHDLLKKHDKVVIATGSQAAPHLGGNSDGEKFAKELNHTIIPAYPSLVQLHLESKLAKNMSGTKINGEVTLFINGQKEETKSGDILFTNYGVSGFAILDISQKASEALMNFYSVDITINLLPSLTPQKISNHIMKMAHTSAQMKILDLLVGITPIKIASNILTHLKISHDTLLVDINTKVSKRVANALTNLKFEVVDTHGFRHAEVSGGGVDTAEINPHTMQSFKNKDVYFCGEVLDVVGRRGGYNFAFAWASAYIAAKDIK